MKPKRIAISIPYILRPTPKNKVSAMPTGIVTKTKIQPKGLRLDLLCSKLIVY